MAPATVKTNYKSFDAQARLLRAIVAAHPEVKWNYKGMSLHYLSRYTFLSSSLSFPVHNDR
jgi:hypothetical protein